MSVKSSLEENIVQAFCVYLGKCYYETLCKYCINNIKHIIIIYNIFISIVLGV